MLIQIWGDEAGSRYEKEAIRIGRALADAFASIEFRLLPRRINYSYYPVIGVLANEAPEPVDPGVRIIGLPAGYQMTTLIAALQSVSFQAQTLEPATRIRLRGLDNSNPPADVTIEVLTSAEDEAGTLIAKHAFGMAVASKQVRSFAIMTDCFPEAALMYSAAYLPHTVVNGRIHYDGPLEERELLQQIGLALAKN